MPEITPNVPDCRLLSGPENCAWFSALKASTRNCTLKRLSRTKVVFVEQGQVRVRHARITHIRQRTADVAEGERRRPDERGGSSHLAMLWLPMAALWPVLLTRCVPANSAPWVFTLAPLIYTGVPVPQVRIPLACQSPHESGSGAGGGINPAPAQPPFQDSNYGRCGAFGGCRDLRCPAVFPGSPGAICRILGASPEP